MNTIPSVDQFLAQSEPDEDEEPVTFELTDLRPHITQIAQDPMERIAEALEAIARAQIDQTIEGLRTVNVYEAEKPRPVITNSSPEQDKLVEGLRENLRSTDEAYADLEAKHQTVLQVISDVEAALGKSKAAPALAAKAVIDGWRNPRVEPAAEDGDPALTGDAVYDSNGLLPPDPELSNPVEPDSVEGHTRTPHPEGADFCRECSGALQEWIVWPCPAVSGEAQPVQTGPEEGHEPVVQPAHNAPVEEWREYARSLGYAGPDIDKANRSMIRTTLGIAQVQ